MAQRRMIDKRFTRTQRFLRLPLETQALYFHLLQDADDDGVVEAFPIVRMIGASEDSLGLLEVKGFVKPLNSEMVYFVIDFSSQNTIRKDRYSASIYSELLVKSMIEDDEQPNGNQMATNGLPKVASEESRVDKNRLDKNREVEASEATSTKSDFQNLIELYQTNFGIVKPILYDDLKADLEDYGLELIIEAVKRAVKRQREYGYAQGILKSWNNKGIKTLEQAKAEEVSFQNKSQNNQNKFQQQKPVKKAPEWTDEGRLIKAGVDTTGMTQNEMYKLVGEMGLRNE
ncbi:DnaD domain protein [Lactococcus lactis]|uniref:DnaD domain-containing protein n=1 Tax=Lactococcus lactis TaxID=1358 RepID=UPI002418B1DB|nr:DnaD domain protein [Lactococcus lactis]MDG4966284.1 DnaD domain protein [Lactococcus lactis]